MKKLILIIFCILNLNVFGTHYLGYYVYVETQYVQGPWKRVNLFNDQESKYLEPRFHEDLLGSLDESLIKTLMGHLKEHSPEFYQWDYVLKVNGDTVSIIPSQPLENFEKLKNEITATLTLNGFSHVHFQNHPSPNIFELSDVSIPYFDLINNAISNQKEVEKHEVKNKRGEEKNTEEEKEKHFPLWAIISLVFNLIFFVVLVFRS